MGKMKARDYADFLDKVSRYYKRLDYCGCNYRVLELIITSEKNFLIGKLNLYYLRLLIVLK